ncbi:hydrolase [Spirochaetia bacterium]|nr:hydrolase [Spirochaetia bacterium]
MDEAERLRLVSLIRESAVPLAPELPPLPAAFGELPALARNGNKIRAVLFDVYGTLFCSAAGDISHAAKDAASSPGAASAGAALDALARQYGLAGEEMRSFFRQKVAGIHQMRLAETPWPEVQVEEIWADFLYQRNSVPFCNGGARSSAASRELALRYELAVNPVYPMPGAAEIIAALQDAGFVMGIISNAQFFTPLLFEAFFGALPKNLGFDPALLIWSFEMGEAKPSPLLFETAAQRLETRGIAVADCAFVGNDMLSDIYGSINAGFQGVLFAGDSRSLRLREGEALVQGLWPSSVIRSLGDLSAILA